MTDRLRIGPLDPAAQQAVRDLAAHAATADGVAPLSEEVLLRLAHTEPNLTHARVLDDAGATVGYAQVDRRSDPPTAEVVVDPAARRRGIGRLLVRTAVRDATLPAFSGEPSRHTALRVWAHGDTTAARALATSLSMTVVRELWMMGRPNDGSEPALADALLAQALTEGGRQVRTINPDTDRDAWLALNRAAFAWHPEQGGWTADDLSARLVEPWFRPDLWWVVEGPSGDLLGSLWLKAPERGGEVEIYVLSVAPAAQGHGLGSALVQLALAASAAENAPRTTLYTEADNAPAVATYRRAGFETISRDVQWAAPSTQN